MLTKLDVSHNIELYRLECQHNQLTNLDVSACTALRQLKSHSNQLTTSEEILSQFQIRIKENRIFEIESGKYAILFPMYQVDGGMYQIFLVEDNNGKFYLSDDGNTYKELDIIFEMSEPDVIKNLVSIMKQYGVRRNPSNNAFTIECTPYDVHLKMSYLIQCLSFMLNMKIFYNC
jgi:Leucine-rich repeat (LRR) protein